MINYDPSQNARGKREIRAKLGPAMNIRKANHAVPVDGREHEPRHSGVHYFEPMLGCNAEDSAGRSDLDD